MTAQPGKIAALDSLRGLLALWVVIAHVTARIISDHNVQRVHAQAVLEPLLPVYVFMILSGFVIFFLLDQARESTGAFLVRRFFRLAPLFLVMLAVAALLTRFELRTLDNLFWRNPHVYDSIKIHQEALDHFWPHMIAHATLLHGLVSDRWLADSNFTFLSQGWSISLEWQFYLVAPLIFACIARARHGLLALVVAALAALGWVQYASAGFLPNQFVYFALGIASYYAWRNPGWFPRVAPCAHDLALLIVALTLYFALKEPLPILAWLLVLDMMLAERTGVATPLTRFVDRVLALPALRRLGEISYSVYLIHMTVLYIVFRAVTRLDPHLYGWKFLAIALPATLGLTLVVAALAYRFVERPGIALGKRLAARIGAGPNMAPQPATP